MGLGVRALRALVDASELSATICGILLADELANLLGSNPTVDTAAAAGPEVFAGEIPILNKRDGDLPFSR
jgi:hypothetical protein